MMMMMMATRQQMTSDGWQLRGWLISNGFFRFKILASSWRKFHLLPEDERVFTHSCALKKRVKQKEHNTNFHKHQNNQT